VSLYDLDREKLVAYRPDMKEPVNFDRFWAETLRAARSSPLDARFDAADFLLEGFETCDVTFSGYGGQPIKAWLILPAWKKGPLPCVVEYLGYGGGRGFPTQYLAYAGAGYAHFLMDTRGQGSGWQNGDTPDVEPDGGNPQFPGFMTRGVLRPETYYYRRLMTDAVRAVEAAKAHPAVDANRIAVAGISQGGGLTLAVAGLVPETVKVAMPEVPFLCHFRRATQITDVAPYNEVANYCKIHRDKVERVFETLAYFDGVHFSRRARAAALFSVGLMDTICPPSTVYAAYNNYAGPKEIRVYEYNNHEGGGLYHVVEKLKFLKAHL